MSNPYSKLPIPSASRRYLDIKGLRGMSQPYKANLRMKSETELANPTRPGNKIYTSGGTGGIVSVVKEMNPKTLVNLLFESDPVASIPFGELENIKDGDGVVLMGCLVKNEDVPAIESWLRKPGF